MIITDRALSGAITTARPLGTVTSTRSLSGVITTDRAA